MERLVSVGFAAKKLGGQDPYWSAELTVAAAVYGTAAHMQIIRFLRMNGPSTRQEIAQSTGLSHGLAAQCLNKLKSAGVVTASLDEQVVRAYDLQPERARDLFLTLESYLHIVQKEQPDERTAVVLPLHGAMMRKTG